MLIDRFLPVFDVTQVCELTVDAPPEETYAAIRETDLRDPVVNALFAFRVEPTGAGGTVLRYEAQTATTDESARRTFGRYWRLIHPGVALVMRRALRRIKLEAERRSKLLAAHQGVPT